MRNLLLATVFTLSFAAAPAHAQQGGGGTGVPCSQASFQLSYGCAIDEQTPSQLHTDLTSPLAAQSGNGVDVGAVELLQTSPSGGNLTAADTASTTSTTNNQGGQAQTSGTPTTGSAITFIFPNAEGTANFNVTGFTGLVTGGAIYSECSPDNAHWAYCPVSLPNQADTISITGNILGGRVSVVGSKYWRLRNTGILSGTGAVTATLTAATSQNAFAALNNQNTSVMSPLQGDASNNLLTMSAAPSFTTVNLSTSTPLNTIYVLYNSTVNGGAQNITLTNVSSSCTAPVGQITAQYSYDGVNFATLPAGQFRLFNGSPGTNPILQGNGVTVNDLIAINGAQIIQLKVTTQLGGTGTCTMTINGQLTNYNPIQQGAASVSAANPTAINYSLSYAGSDYPSTNGVPPNPLVAKATGSTGAVTATLTGTSTTTVYICHFDVSAVGGTASVGPITVTGLQGGTWTYQLPVNPMTQPFDKTFPKCLPASGTNQAIAVNTTADGTATAVDVNVSGYYQ